MECSNFLLHIPDAAWLGQGLCDLETSAHDYILGAGYEPFDFVFKVLLLSVLIIVLIQLTFRGHDLSIGGIAKLAIFVGALIVMGVL